MALATRSMRFLYLGLFLLAAAGPSLVKANTTGSRCITFELSTSLGRDSTTYIWSKSSSKKHTANLPPLAPPTDHPSTVTVMRFENRFPSGTPIHINGLENLHATYLMNQGLAGNKATVAIRAELESLNAKIFSLPAEGEILNLKTYQYDSFYVVEEKGQPVFYPNQEAAHSKMGGKSLSQIGAEFIHPDRPQFHLTLSNGKQNESINFFKIYPGKEWDCSFTVDESKIRPLEPVKLLSAPEFEQKYPHNANDMSKAQTLFLVNGKEEYLLSGYNPETGTVTVEKDHIKIVDLKPDPKDPNQLITSDKITLTREMPQTRQFPQSRSIHPGDLVLGSDGFTYEVRSYHSHDQAKAFLRRTEQREMMLSVFEDSLKDRKIPNSDQKEIVDTEQGLLGKMKTLLGSLRDSRSQVRLLGAQNVSRLDIKGTRFEGHGNRFLGNEMTYQIRGPKGDSKFTVRISRESLTKSDLKRVDALVSQMAASQADAVRSVELIDENVDRALQSPNLEYEPAAGRCHPDGTVEIINFFQRTPESTAKTLWHEMGHAFALKVWNSFQPGQEWVRAAVLDGHFISGYSQFKAEKKPLVEDFAETVAAYIATDGGRTQPGLRRAFKNRFEFLDRAVFPH